jgi:hypothetical protein
MRCDWLAFALALGLAGCTPELCQRNSDCAAGLVCTQAGVCAIPVDTSGDAGTDGSHDAASDGAADAAADTAADAPVEPIDAAVGVAFQRSSRIQRIWRTR